MDNLQRVRERIREIAGRRHNVKFSEIEWVFSQLKSNGFPNARSRNNGHQTIFSVAGQRFGVCTHNPGSKQIKACYVDAFLQVMIELELYEE